MTGLWVFDGGGVSAGRGTILRLGLKLPGAVSAGEIFAVIEAVVLAVCEPEGCSGRGSDERARGRLLLALSAFIAGFVVMLLWPCWMAGLGLGDIAVAGRA